MNEFDLLTEIEDHGIKYAENKVEYDYLKKCLDIELEELKSEVAIAYPGASEATLKRKAIKNPDYRKLLKRIRTHQKEYLVADAKLKRLITYKEFLNAKNNLTISKINKGIDV